MFQNRPVCRTFGGALAASLLVLSFGALGACKKKDAPTTTTTTTTPSPGPNYNPPVSPAPAPASVQLSEVRVGKAIGSDKVVSTPAEAFAGRDTVYVSVATTGSSAAVPVRALWTYQDGQVVSDDSQTIAATGADVTEFHISKPDGFPAGSYKVEIFVNGLSVATRGFMVQ